MTGRTFLALALLLSWQRLVAAEGEVRLRAQFLDLTVHADTGAISVASLRAPGFLRAAEVRVADGRSGQRLGLGSPTVGGEAAAPTLFWAPEPSLSVRLGATVVGRCLVWQVDCANTAAEPRWLEVGPAMTVAVEAAQGHWFDGWDDLGVPADRGHSERVAGNLPLTAVWSSGACVAVGLEPSELVSYFRHQVETTPEGWKDLSCIVRLVLAPGQSQTVRFVLMAPPGDWGKYEAFEAYYDSFPRFFLPHPGVDPRVGLGLAQQRTWPPGPWSGEICRRLFAGWEWCSASFRRSGDIVGRPELWEYTPARPFSKDQGKTRDDTLRERAAAFAAGDANGATAMVFCLASQVWCEEQLARERYADALVTDPEAQTYLSTPWVTGHDNELRVLPYGTSFAEQSRKDLAELAATLPLSGFAFDRAGGVARYTGPALPRLEGRAWDPDLAVYCSELIAVARLMDTVHTLERGGRPLAVVAKPTASGAYAACFRCDSAVLEGSPWQDGRRASDRLRWKLGRKPLVCWDGYAVEDRRDPTAVTPEQLAAVYEDQADSILRRSLRLGCIPPTNVTQGVARLARWLPAIVDCVQAGWQPVPAVRIAEPSWGTRYGLGLQTRLALAHETGQVLTAQAVIENARLGQGTFLFAHDDGRELSQNVREGATLIPLELPARQPVLLRALVEVRPRAAVTAAVVSQSPGLRRTVVEATLAGQGSATVRVAVPAGMALVRMICDGLSVPVQPEGPICQAEVELGERTLILAEFVSGLFQLEDAELLEYPFVRAGQPACVIVDPAVPGSGVSRPALRLREYFRYWYGRAQRPAVEVVLPVLDTPAEGSRSVRLRIALGAVPSVRRQGDNLVIDAPDLAQLNSTMDRLLRALDRKYWTCDWFSQEAVRERLATGGQP
jgi:hypothetical protein